MWRIHGLTREDCLASNLAPPTLCVISESALLSSSAERGHSYLLYWVLKRTEWKMVHVVHGRHSVKCHLLLYNEFKTTKQVWPDHTTPWVLFFKIIFRGHDSAILDASFTIPIYEIVTVQPQETWRVSLTVILKVCRPKLILQLVSFLQFMNRYFDTKTNRVKWIDLVPMLFSSWCAPIWIERLEMEAKDCCAFGNSGSIHQNNSLLLSLISVYRVPLMFTLCLYYSYTLLK